MKTWNLEIEVLPIALTLLFLFPMPAFSQQQGEVPDFYRLSAEEQEKFKDRLTQYLVYYRSKNWPGLYNMFSKKHPLTKEEFLEHIEKYGKHRLLDFTFDKVEWSGGLVNWDWQLDGCAKLKAGFGSKKWSGGIYASLENGNWVFSDVMFQFQSLHSRDPIPCKLDSRK